jgi:hypothetical protein
MFLSSCHQFKRFSLSVLSIVLITVAALLAQKISPYLVGNNVWLPGELTDEIWQISSQCPLQILRIGGEGYDRGQFNQAQLDGFIEKIQNTCKAQPILQIPQNSTADYAASLVQKYSKDRTSNKVIYYNIGNEPGLGGANAGTIAGYIKNLAPAMKAVDPAIKIFAFDECDLNYNNLAAQLFDTPNGANDITGKDAKGNWYVDGLAWHRYPIGKQNDLAYAGYSDLAERIRGAKEMVDRANKRQNRTGEAALGWGIGEYNAPDGPSVHTFANGQMIGGVLGQCMKYEATYACYWDLFERGGVRTNPTDFSWIDGVGGKRPRATYWHMAFVSREFSGTFADGTCTVADVLTYGCKDTDKLAAIIINRANRSQSYTLRFDKTSMTTGDCRINIDAGVAVQVQGSLVGLATQCLVFNLKGELVRRYTYTKDDFDKLAEPKIEQTSPVKPKSGDDLNAPAYTINTSSTGLTIMFPAQQRFEMELLDCNGRVVSRQSGNDTKTRIDTRAFAPGTYLLKVEGCAGVIRRQCFVGGVR